MNDMELADWLHRWRECLRCEAPCQAYPCICSQRTDAIIAALRRERPSSGEMMVPRLETEAMQDSVRGILQAIRCNPGVTEDQVYQHCKLRGDSTKGLHENDGSYVTEARAAAMIYRAMLSAAEAEGRKGPSTEGDDDSYVTVENYNNLLEHSAKLERRLSLAQTEIEGHMRVEDELRAECATLVAGSCVHELVGDPYGHFECSKVIELRATIRDLSEENKTLHSEGILLHATEAAIKQTKRAEQAEARIAELEKDWETDTDYIRMAERIKELEKLLGEALENLIWCGGSADFGWGGKAQVGYDKGPRTTIAAIHEALKSRA